MAERNFYIVERLSVIHQQVKSPLNERKTMSGHLQIDASPETFANIALNKILWKSEQHLLFS